MCGNDDRIFHTVYEKIDFKLQKKSVPYMAGMILLGTSTAYTSSSFFHFFNMLGIILLFSVFMIHQCSDRVSVWQAPDRTSGGRDLRPVCKRRILGAFVCKFHKLCDGISMHVFVL